MVHGLKTLPNHFSKVTAATSVNDVIAVNNMNKDPQKRITLGRDMDITVENKINISLGKRPDMWKDESVGISRGQAKPRGSRVRVPAGTGAGRPGNTPNPSIPDPCIPTM